QGRTIEWATAIWFGLPASADIATKSGTEGMSGQPKPRPLTSALHCKVDGWAHDVDSLKPRVKQVPAVLVGRFLAGSAFRRNVRNLLKFGAPIFEARKSHKAVHLNSVRGAKSGELHFSVHYPALSCRWVRWVLADLRDRRIASS